MNLSLLECGVDKNEIDVWNTEQSRVEYRLGVFLSKKSRKFEFEIVNVPLYFVDKKLVGRKICDGKRANDMELDWRYENFVRLHFMYLKNV